ncbi:hypothetical protein NFI96_025535 [Prochilodus magdalenae]|nr:hypothetical protein NFI96_025535 [Prochilodus magdalenae]
MLQVDIDTPSGGTVDGAHRQQGLGGMPGQEDCCPTAVGSAMHTIREGKHSGLVPRLASYESASSVFSAAASPVAQLADEASSPGYPDNRGGGAKRAMIYIVLAPSRPPPTYRRFQTVRATAGDTVRLPCRLSPNISAPVREVRWFKGADCVEVFQISGGEEAAEETPSNRRDVSLTLYDVKVTDSGQYRCEMLGERKEDILFIHLHVSEFRLVFDSKDVGKPSRIQPLGYKSRERSPPDFSHHAFFGDATLPCYLSPETSAAAMEIRWFKGTDWIYLYQNGQVTEGRGYKGRVSLFTSELQKGNVSLRLRDTQESDSGRYRCVVTHGGRKVTTDVIDFTVAGTEKTFLRKVYVFV